MRLTTIVFCSVPLLVLCAGCATQSTSSEPPASYQELKQEELASERDDYIEDTQRRLKEVDRDIDHVKAKLEHESEFVGEEKRASWKEDLFELQQERAELGARLERARTSSPAEWEEMRGTLGTATDSLQAGVRKLRVEVSEAVKVDNQPTAATGEDRAKDRPNADSGLCQVDMSGLEADVQRGQNRIVVMLTTDTKSDVAELQRRASDLASSTKTYEVKAASDTPLQDKSDPPPQAAKDEPAAHRSVPVAVAMEKVQDGAKLSFVPSAAALEPLRARLVHDAENLEEGRCQPTQVSLKTTPER